METNIEYLKGLSDKLLERFKTKSGNLWPGVQSIAVGKSVFIYVLDAYTQKIILKNLSDGEKNFVEVIIVGKVVLAED